MALFSTHVREPAPPGSDPDRRRRPGRPDAGEPRVGDIERLLQAYAELLPAVNTLVGHHFTRTLVNVALDHVDQVGSDAERRAIGEQIDGRLGRRGPTGTAGHIGRGAARP